MSEQKILFSIQSIRSSRSSGSTFESTKSTFSWRNAECLWFWSGGTKGNEKGGLGLLLIWW